MRHISRRKSSFLAPFSTPLKVRGYTRAIFFIIIVLFVSVSFMGCGNKRQKLPNLVLITIDTLRADHLGTYGYDRAHTPNIDAFARSAIQYNRALTVSNNTLPAHLSMLTGHHPQEIGVHRNGHKLPSGIPTLAALLRARGYETAAFVSASSLSSRLNVDRGFDIYDEDFDIKEMDQVQRRAEDTIRMAIRWLNQKRDRPFFLWVHLFDPHYPYTPPPPFDSLFGNDYRGPADGSMRYLLTVWGRGVPRVPTTRADRERLIDLYDGEIAYVDSSLHPLLSFFDLPEIRDNTAVVITADHGESLTEHNYLFDHGEFVYQPSIHIPFLLRFPGSMNVSPGTNNSQVQVHDIFPTFLSLAGAHTQESISGRNLIPVKKNEFPEVRSVSFSESCRPWSVERLNPNEYPNLRKAQSAVEWPFKLIVTPYLNKKELYNIETDKEELKDLSLDHPDIVQNLFAELKAFRHTKIQFSEPDPENLEQLKALGYIE
jgi:arylsulfatase A-like enzyme